MIWFKSKKIKELEARLRRAEEYMIYHRHYLDTLQEWGNLNKHNEIMEKEYSANQPNMLGNIYQERLCKKEENINFLYHQWNNIENEIERERMLENINTYRMTK